jgi:uncharacterized protein (DUF1499 family)
MTKAELISALEWFKDDVELYIVVPHETIAMHETLRIEKVQYQLNPSEVQIVATRDPVI